MLDCLLVWFLLLPCILDGFFSFLGLAQAISRARAVGFLSLSVGISQSVGLLLYWMG
nr:hypothetical protein Q903MT_gene6506 [Picea sitchensis]